MGNQPEHDGSVGGMTMTSDSQGASMSIWSMSWASIRYGWRVSLSVALGVATATAVIVGALLVGDSMRGSLRELTIERLGRTESLIMPGTFFEADGIVEGSTPLVFFSRGAIETRQQGATGVRRAGSVQVIGCGERFWDLDVTGVRPSKLPGGNSVVLNQSAATELGVKVGDLVTVRLPVQQAVPADSPLGRRDIQTEGLPRMEVLDIIPDRGLGRFSITPSQSAPQNVYLSLATVTDVLDRDGQANMLLLDRPATNDDLEIDLSDLGLTLQRVTRTFEPPDSDPAVIYDYYSLTSSQLLLSKSVVDRVTETLGSEKVVPVLTYLANAIERVDESGNVIASVPYSTISAIDSSPPLTLDYGDGSAAQSGVVPLVINDWAAKQLDAVVGMPLRIAYYEPEVENGREIERYFDAIVAGIVPITEPATPYTRIEAATFDKPPTVYNDPNLTPSVPGVTDQASISDWDLPFALERKISGVDDTYWNQYRLTPKAYLPLDDGRKLFGSRFGHTTGLRIDAAAAGSAAQLRSQLTAALQPIAADLGWSVRPIREQQLAASRGTTPFDYLFLALSFFVILAAVMLIVMLFWLGLVQRLGQFGTLLATGWPPRRVTALARDEGFLVAAVGVAIGVVGGVCYAAVVLWALRSLWVGAVTVPFLTFHWTYTSLIVGAASGWFVAAAALIFTARALTRINVQTLLSGRDIDAQLQPPASAGKARRSGRGKWNVIVLVTAIFAVIVAAAGAAVGGQAAAGGFVGGGMMLLAAGLTAIYARLRRPRRIGEDQAQATGGSYSLGTLAARNASRHPLRSTLTIGLMATASFLIIAISAFRLEPTEQGTGGFDLVAQSAQPVYRDLSQPDVQSSIMGTDAKTLSDAVVVPMRMRLGQDASCNNLYQASQPTVLGVPDSVDAAMIGDLSQLPGFEWWATAETDDGESPWALLSRSASGTKQDPIPLILDQNTAVYSLQMLGGIGQVKSFEYGAGNEISFRVVGLLSNSLLQGKLMIGNDNFERVFEDVSGYQYFLVACDDTDRDAISDSLESRLGDVGMDVSDASAVLSGMLAVQNTYLRTFQSLGALGLLLGTIGLAVSQLRSVLERRRELAVLRAIGFTRKRLAAMVMRETASLLLAGIGCGVACAVLAVVPHAILSGLKPPLVEPIVMVIGIILFGMLAGIIAVGRVVRMPLMESLRSE
jgi:putative ABC transport system permease protein